MGRKCIFFDRDGIVNAAPPKELYYVVEWKHFHLIPEFVDVLRLCGKIGYESVVVTNQAGIGKGRVTREAVDEIHANLLALLREHGVDLLDIMMCPSADDNHTHRKPNPGMILEAAEKHGLDLATSWMVGDQERDVVAGRRAGCRTILVKPGVVTTTADFHVQSMAELLGFMRKHL